MEFNYVQILIKAISRKLNTSDPSNKYYVNSYINIHITFINYNLFERCDFKI